MTSKPTHLIRNDNIQSGATTCTLFDREEALRHDDAIMDFQWFSTISWTEIRDLRGTTYVQPPTRLWFVQQQTQHAILLAIAHNGPSTPNSEPAWKVLLLSSWLLFGRPAENASDANCSNFLKARLDLFWSEDSPALWALVRAECDVPSIAQTRSRTKAEQTQARIRKIPCVHVLSTHQERYFTSFSERGRWTRVAQQRKKALQQAKAKNPAPKDPPRKDMQLSPGSPTFNWLPSN